MEWIEEVMNDEGASNVNMMKIISEEMLDEDKKELKRSAGVGVRVFLPMFGLLGLDWGYRFDDIPGRSGMDRSQIHFTIGANLGSL